MVGGFEQYEREYLKRVTKGKPAPEESYASRMARLRMEQMDAIVEEASSTRLDSWDYAILHMIWRRDPRGQMRFGTMRTCESLLKLHCHGLIRKLDRDLTFDEMERMQAFFDSASYRQYKDRLKKIMTKESEKRLRDVAEILGIRDMTDMMDITGEGRKALNEKRTEITNLYKSMAKQYSQDMERFYEAAPSYSWALPMLVVMGFSGFMMGHMLASSDAQYAALDYGSHAHVHWVDLSPDTGDFNGVNFVGGW